MVDVGFNLAPNPASIALCEPVFERVDYVELLPESLWAPDDRPGFRPNGLFHTAVALLKRHDLPVVAHGVGLSMAGSGAADQRRVERWLSRIEALHQTFDFRWYTDHWGITAPAGHNLMLPMSVPLTEHTLQASRARLQRLSEIVPLVGVENSVFYANAADPLDQAAFLGHVLGDRFTLLLDVHNLWTDHCNHGLDIEAWLAAAPLDRVVEIHVSGGSWSEEAWFRGRKMRLDSHDEDVPEKVWSLLADVLPRCANLRGVTLERLEGTVSPDDVPGLVRAVERIRLLLPLAGCLVQETSRVSRDWPEADDGYASLLVQALAAADPIAAMTQISQDPSVCAAHRAAFDQLASDRDGLRLTTLLIARLRFERLLQGCDPAHRWFDADPQGFSEAFRDYVAAVPARAFLPLDEAALWTRWRSTMA